MQSNQFPNPQNFTNSQNKQVSSKEDQKKQFAEFFKKENLLKNSRLTPSLQYFPNFPLNLFLLDQNFGYVDYYSAVEYLQSDDFKDIATIDQTTSIVTVKFKLDRNVLHIYGLKTDKLNQFFDEIASTIDPDLKREQPPTNAQFEHYHDNKESLYIQVKEGQARAVKILNQLMNQQLDGQRIDVTMRDQLTISQLQIPPQPLIYYPPNFTYYPNYQTYPKKQNNYGNSSNNNQYNNTGYQNNQNRGNPRKNNKEFTGKIENEFPQLSGDSHINTGSKTTSGQATGTATNPTTK